MRLRTWGECGNGGVQGRAAHAVTRPCITSQETARTNAGEAYATLRTRRHELEEVDAYLAAQGSPIEADTR